MYRKMLGKCRRAVAIALAGAMMFGSAAVMAEGDEPQNAEQEMLVATDDETVAEDAAEEAVAGEVAAEETEATEKTLPSKKETTEDETEEITDGEGETETPEGWEDETVFSTTTKVWNGEYYIYFNVDTQGAGVSEFSYRLTTHDGNEYGGGHDWMDNMTGLDPDGRGQGEITFNQRLEDMCVLNSIQPEDVKEIEFILVLSKESASVVKTVKMPVNAKKPQISLASGTWTGENDIVLEVQAEAYTVAVYETYWWNDKMANPLVEIGEHEISVDENGKGTIVFKNDALKNAKTLSQTGETVKIDWTKAARFEFATSCGTVYVPVAYKGETSEDSETVTIKDESGVSMNLPANAPEGLSLKVGESNGSTEKAAVSKLVQVNGERIKTFDLSLLLNGEVYEYNGQFKSKVTLPVPEGWNLDLLGLYYFDEATGKAEAVSFIVDKANRTITFETDHFSKFVLVEKVAEQKNAVSDNPKTGDEANAALYMFMFLAAGAALIVSYRRKQA